MCFNATASFTGAAVVTVAGVAALTMVRDKRQIPFAALPLLFGIHQALEGVTWLELDGATDAELSGWGVHLWVMFAWAILPLYVPWAVRIMEPDSRRRRWLLAPLIIGAAVFAYMFYAAVQPEIRVEVAASNLDYELGVPLGALIAVPYVIATCFGPMLSSFPYVIAMGAGNFVAMSVAFFIEVKDYSSLWCTFAAFLSLIIVAHFWTERRHSARAGPGRPVHAA